MLPPNNVAIRQLSQEEGISEATLHKWRAEARGKGQLLPDADAGPEGWSSRDKFAAVLETASLNEADLAEYCRKRGLYPAQIAAWRSACEQANDWDRASSARLGRATKEEKKRVKDLERELARKDRALAETAALLVLRKKAAAIWGAVFVKEVVRCFHAASLISGAPISVSGLSQTGPAGCQLRVLSIERTR